MLVLSRREGEGVVIGDDIHICVLKQEGGRVRLGITAPRTVHIARAEILDTPPSDQDRSTALTVDHDVTSLGVARHSAAAQQKPR